MPTRREILKTAGKTATVLTTTAPWWLVRRAHAARQAKLVVWNPAALAPQVDKIMQEQCYAYAKQAGIKESEIDYQIIGGPQLVPQLVAALEARNPPDITRLVGGRAGRSPPRTPPPSGVRPGATKPENVMGGLFLFPCARP